MTDILSELKNETSTRPSIRTRIDGALKRGFDLFAAFFGLIIVSPFFLLIAWFLKRESPGPVFYRGPRMGRNGVPFGILKFRTMYERPESYAGPQITAANDDRITPLGRWLRENKLNELPQLWNVLKGEMSLVGPRPEDPSIVESWPSEARAEILSVRPGITSPASVIYRDEEKLLQAGTVMDDYLQTVLPGKLRLDQLYVRSRSLLGDLDVIFTTLASLTPQYRESPFHLETLFNGTLSRLVSRYLSWFIVDGLVAFTAVSTAGLLYRIRSPLELGLGHAVEMAVVMAFICSLVNMIMGLGSVSWNVARPAYALDLFLSSAVTTLGISAMNLLWPHRHFFPAGMVLVAGILSYLGFLTVRFRHRLLTGFAWRWLSRRPQDGTLRERVLIVGAGEGGLLVSWLIQHSRLARHFTITGMVDDDPKKDGLTIDGHRVFGLTRRIPELVEKHDIGVILFAIEKIRPEEQQRIINLCRRTPARLVLVPDLLEIIRQRMSSPSPNAEDIPTRPRAA